MVIGKTIWYRVNNSHFLLFDCTDLRSRRNPKCNFAAMGHGHFLRKRPTFGHCSSFFFKKQLNKQSKVILYSMKTVAICLLFRGILKQQTNVGSHWPGCDVTNSSRNSISLENFSERSVNQTSTRSDCSEDPTFAIIGSSVGVALRRGKSHQYHHFQTSWL
jgi:hypothetical protein